MYTNLELTEIEFLTKLNSRREDCCNSLQQPVTYFALLYIYLAAKGIIKMCVDNDQCVQFTRFNVKICTLSLFLILQMNREIYMMAM